MKNNNQAIKSKIYHEIRTLILNKRLSRGERLVENDIAASYNVNKLHVRDALQKLVVDELVEHQPMKGYIVRGISTVDLLEIAKLRMVLESLVIEDFILHALPSDIEEAKRLTRRKIVLLENSMPEDAAIESKATYEKMYEKSSFPRAVKFLRKYSFYIDILIKESMAQPMDISLSIQNSRLLFQALEKKDLGLMKKWITIRYEKVVEKLSK